MIVDDVEPITRITSEMFVTPTDIKNVNATMPIVQSQFQNSDSFSLFDKNNFSIASLHGMIHNGVTNITEIQIAKAANNIHTELYGPSSIFYDNASVSVVAQVTCPKNPAEQYITQTIIEA